MPCLATAALKTKRIESCPKVTPYYVGVQSVKGDPDFALEAFHIGLWSILGCGLLFCLPQKRGRRLTSHPSGSEP